MPRDNFVVIKNVFRKDTFQIETSLINAAISFDQEIFSFLVVLQKLNRQFVYHDGLFVLYFGFIMIDNPTGH